MYDSRSTSFDGMAADSHAKTRDLSRKICFVALLLIFAGVLTVGLTTSKEAFLQFLSTFIAWVQANKLLGVFAVIGVYFVATLCFMPGLLLTMATGFAFGSACNNNKLEAVALASFVRLSPG